ncbi:MAG TPA: hypothetical protein VE619_01795 [Nitrososphaeraceae archaeon]|nr:hypothetical protein [Nitrososphaeraceae archaeon]
MGNPIHNIVYEKIRQAGNINDSELINLLLKENNIILSEANFNKVLLDLEIYGLIRVTWVTKDKRRIEVTGEGEVKSTSYYGDSMD